MNGRTMASGILKAHLSSAAWSFAIFSSSSSIFFPTWPCWSTKASLAFFLKWSTFCLRREKRAAFFRPSAWNTSRPFRDDEWETQLCINKINKPWCTHRLSFACRLILRHFRWWEGRLGEDLRESISLFMSGGGTIPLTVDFGADFIGGHLRLDHEGGIFLKN